MCDAWVGWAGRLGGAGLLVGMLLAGVLLAGCGVYSLTGATLPAHLETIAVPLAEDRSASGVPGLDQTLTDRLQERFVQQTRLRLAADEDAADAVLTARIDRYTNQPTAVTGQAVAALNRVTVAVTVRYYDRPEDRDRLNRSFSAFAEYDPVADGPAGEAAAAERALEQIAGDVFTAATSDW